MTRIVRQVADLPRRSPRTVLTGWLICGTALPWVRPKRHAWAQRPSSEPWASTVLVCTRCIKETGF